MPRFASTPSEQQVQDVAKYGTVNGIDTTGYGQGSMVVQAATYFGYVTEAIADFRREAGHVHDSTRLTPEGRAQDLGALGAAFLDRLAKFNDAVPAIQRAIDAKLKEITVTAPVSGDATADAVLAAEIRGALPDDTLKVREIFMAAIDLGDQATYDAIRKAPPFMKFADKKTLADGEIRWAAKRNPAKAKEIKDLRAAATALTAKLDQARKMIVSESGIKVDVLAGIAATGKVGA